MTDRGRFDYLDGLRALAIGAVLGVHWVEDYLVLGRGGHIGVDLFFVLSGFIITTILWRSKATTSVGRQGADFLVRRVRRLYPALIGLAVVVPLIGFVVPVDGASPGDIVRQAGVALVQMTWLTSAQGEFENIFGHTWSLGIEWVFYLIWPWIVIVARRRGVAPGKVALLAGGLALVLYASSFALSPTWFAFGPSGRMGVMLAGAALALWMAAAPPRQAPAHRTHLLDALAVASVLLFTAYVLVGHRTFDPGVRAFGVPLATATGCYLIWYGYVRSAGPVHWLLTLPAMTFVGRISYSLYLWHIAPVAFLDKDQLDLPGPLLGLMGVGFAVVATALSYTLLERPFLRSRGNALAPVTASGTAPASAPTAPTSAPPSAPST